ncbi:MAG: ATP-binding protein [Gemmatimonadales bacterium]
MTRVVEVPVQFDDRSLDQFARSCGGEGDRRLLFDAHATQWASPYGLVALMVAGQAISEREQQRPLLAIPSDRDVLHYWARAGFFEYAGEWFEIHGKVPRINAARTSDVLLEITPVGESGDVHGVVSVIQDRASAILAGKLGLEASATMGFGMALSEACQNIVEHAGTSGWVAVQTYHWRRRLGRRVVVIAVADAGMGFRKSLETAQAGRYGDRWNDATALEAALIQGVSRLSDPGRGQGLGGIRRYLSRWNGKISIRSGTARITIVPGWDDDEPLKDGLPFFPGSQMLQIIPARQGDN